MPRIAGAIFRAATDPDLATSGCPWVLPDDGPVIRIEKEALRTGVYEMINDRIRRANTYVPFYFSVRARRRRVLIVGHHCSFATIVGDWVRWIRDLSIIFRPVLIVFVPVVVLAVAVLRGLVTIPF